MCGVHIVDAVYEVLGEDGALRIADEVDGCTRIRFPERGKGGEGDDEVAYGASPKDQDALN